MRTDPLGVPVSPSARAALVELHADLAQLIAKEEVAFAVTVKPNAPKLVGPAMDALVAVVHARHPTFSQRLVVDLICSVNPWASPQKYKRWKRRARSSP